MSKLQIAGLTLIIICGAVSQFFNLNGNQWAVWGVALGMVMGIVMVISEWFTKKKED